MQKALTIGEIARRLDWPIHRVDYFLRSRRIEPKARAGILRIFGGDVIERLRSEADRAEQASPTDREVTS
ncbi:MAG: hypothetical protein QM570_04860 [Planctomycetota bacterium]|nr:hypothetical protein [Planctomycetota bacterium]